MRKPSPFFEGVKLRDLHRVYRTFVPHLRKYRRRFVLAYLALFAAMLMNLLKPWPLKIILDYIILGKAMPRRLVFVNSIASYDQVVLLAILCAGIVAIFLLEGLFTFIRKYFMEDDKARRMDSESFQKNSSLASGVRGRMSGFTAVDKPRVVWHIRCLCNLPEASDLSP